MNRLRLKKDKGIEGNKIKDERNLFIDLEKDKAIKDNIIRDIRNFFEIENEEQDYYKPLRVGNFCNNNTLNMRANRDKNKTLSIKEYLNEMKLYF